MKTDFFALLSETRRPWLDAESLKQKFHQLSGQNHPDRTHSGTDAERRQAEQAYADLTAAYTCLKDPRTRLGHLLELECRKPSSEQLAVPTEMAEVIFAMGGECRKAAEYYRQSQAATSPLVRVGVFEAAQPCLEALVAWQKKLNDWKGTLEREIIGIDSEWSASGAKEADLIPRLEVIYHALGYVNNWAGRIQESIFQLSTML